MRRTALVLTSSLFLLLSGAPLASANTTPLSFDISYSLKPFSFYCDPYKDSFESNKHYLPTGPSCTFSVPAAVSGTFHGIFVYKGVPGNATGVGGDQYTFSAPTLIREDSMSFGTSAQDDDYFGVIFGANSQADIAQFDAAFRTGSSTNTLLPSDNYRLIRWKWGAKPASEYDPVIIIPGILGSWEKNGTWVVDPILHTYDNLIDTFLANGYVENKTLFRFGYDWEEPNEVSAHVLAGKIDQIKQTCGCKKVDVIAHSMGGLVALYYAENSEYKNDIDQLFLVATPILGAPFAYNAWEGGIITSSSTSFLGRLRNNLEQRIFTQEARDAGFNDIFEYVRNKPVESVHELLPVTYDYLFDSTYSPLPAPVNGFLEGILQNIGVVRTLRLEQIVADNGLRNTISGFIVKPSTQLPKWADGEPVQTLFDAGDGTVPAYYYPIGESLKQFDGVEHNEVASTSASYIFKELNNKDVDILKGKFYGIFDIDYSILIKKLIPSPSNTRAVTNTIQDILQGPVRHSVLFLLLFSPIDMQITAPDGKHLGRDFTTGAILNEIPNVVYSGPDAEHEFALILDPLPGQYKVETIGTGNGPYTIATSYIDSTTVSESQISGTTTLNQIISNTLVLSSTSTSLVISKNNSDSSAPKLTTDSCLTDIAKAYQSKWVNKNVYDGVVSGCKALATLFKTRNEIAKIAVTKRTDAQKELFAATEVDINLTLEHMGLLANDKDNTKEGVDLINKYITWFRNLKTQ